MKSSAMERGWKEGNEQANELEQDLIRSMHGVVWLQTAKVKNGKCNGH